MFARRKPKKGKSNGSVAKRVNKIANDAAAKGEKAYQSDLAEAQKKEAAAKKPQRVYHAYESDYQSVYREQAVKAGVNATPVKDVQTRKSSGMYKGSMPVVGTSNKKLARKRSTVKGIRNSDAKASVKRSMIKRIKGANQ